ncbi:uncharacterized protein LOC135196883 [Macrobrachium nipponense]|uniref:uncharacterized protein LOC135196883 n=1 Tax=Macrobrachium nipponense TaxID=159736 RepID=UPI0030C84308
MHIPYFNMFWLNVALWTIILLFYLAYSTTLVVDQCVICCRRKKKHQKGSHSTEMTSVQDTLSDDRPQTEGEVCTRHSTSCSALNERQGLPQDGHTLRHQQAEEVSDASSVSR